MKFAIIGLGHFGKQLAMDLVSDKHQVVAIDTDERAIEGIKDEVDFAVIADASDYRALDELALDEMDTVVVAIGQDWGASLMVTGHLQELNVKNIICRSINPTHQKILGLMKIGEIVHAEEMAARQLAKRLKIRGASRHFELSADYSIVELKVPKKVVGMTLAEAHLPKERLTVVTIKRILKEEAGEEGEETKEPQVKMLGVVGAETKMEEDDRLIVFGTDEDISRFAGER